MKRLDHERALLGRLHRALRAYNRGRLCGRDLDSILARLREALVAFDGVPLTRYTVESGMGAEGNEYAILDNLRQEYTDERFDSYEDARAAINLLDP